MKVRYGEEVANHSDPESCGLSRERQTEALTGETGRPAIEPRNRQSGMPTELRITEGNTVYGDNRKPYLDPARSETLRMLGSFLHRRTGSPPIRATWPGWGGKVIDRNPAIYAGEMSDTSIVPKKPPKKGYYPAEGVE